MKYFQLFVFVVSLLAALPASAGSEGGNGGGGVTDQGVSMTFYSAGLYVEPRPKNIEDVPGLDYLLRAWNGFDFLNPNERDRFKNVIIPSPQHLYFKVSEDSFDDETLKSIKTAYQEVTHIDPSKITLFAITDTTKRQTFLLPSFYSLKNPEERAAILFHEAYWLAHPTATYGEVVAVEMAFEAMLREPSNSARVVDFLSRFATRSAIYRYALKKDFASGALQGFAYGQRQVSLYLLLGPQYLKCIENEGGSCGAYLNLHFSDLVSRYPRSLFLRVLRDDVGAHGEGAIKLGHIPFTYDVIRYRSWFTKYFGNGEYKEKYRESARPYCEFHGDLSKCFTFTSYIWRDQTYNYQQQNDENIGALYRLVALFRGEADPSVSKTKKVPSCSLSQNMPACMSVTLEVRTGSSGNLDSEYLPLTDMGQSRSLAQQFYMRFW
jgi:hypothetical protein